jgi:hypothetical protein
MNKTLYCLIFLFCSFASPAQTIVEGIPDVTTIINFNTGIIPGFIPDTALNSLWQIGHSHKTFFGSATGPMAIMTDTSLFYPIRANNWFTVKVRNSPNVIIDFWHRYQTDSIRDGGLVEFSMDHGMTWQNIKGSCNIDSGGATPGVLTDNFYTFNDTLTTGEPSFTGASSSTQFSRFQFFVGLPISPPSSGGSGGCSFFSVDTFYIRFRFISDSIPDTLAGWIIDSIKIERDLYGGLVKQVNNQNSLNIFPNPSYGPFTFPALENEQQYKLEVYNSIGERILSNPYQHTISLNAWPPGLYFYRVTDGINYYSGKLLLE